MICAVIFYALSEGAGFGLTAGLWAGFLLEVFVAGKFGLQMALWGTAGVSAGLLSSKIFPDSLPAQFFLPLLAQAFLSGMSLHLRGRGSFAWEELLMTALWAPMLFRLLPRRHHLR